MEEVDGNKMSPNEGNNNKDDMAKIIKKRNARLVKLFEVMELPVKVIGDDNNPVMIYNEQFLINAYVHNFELRFTDNPDKGKQIYMIKLLDIPHFDKNRVMQCINDYPVNHVRKVYLKNTHPLLYLTGYNYLNRREKIGRYPVFASCAPKCFFSDERASEVTRELTSEGYDCEFESAGI